MEKRRKNEKDNFPRSMQTHKQFAKVRRSSDISMLQQWHLLSLTDIQNTRAIQVLRECNMDGKQKFASHYVRIKFSSEYFVFQSKETHCLRYNSCLKSTYNTHTHTYTEWRIIGTISFWPYIEPFFIVATHFVFIFHYRLFNDGLKMSSNRKQTLYFITLFRFDLKCASCSCPTRKKPHNRRKFAIWSRRKKKEHNKRKYAFQVNVNMCEWVSERRKRAKETPDHKNGGVRSGVKIDVKTMKWLNERHTKPYKAK